MRNARKLTQLSFHKVSPPKVFTKPGFESIVWKETKIYILVSSQSSSTVAGVFLSHVVVELDKYVALRTASGFVAGEMGAACCTHLCRFGTIFAGLTTCPVGGEKLEDKVVEVMFGTKLVRFCCEKCAAKFEQDPAKYEGKLAPAAEEKKDEEKKDEKAKDGGK